MKFLVAGTRDLRNRQQVYDALDHHAKYGTITEIVTGMALYWLWHTDPELGGPDRYGYDWARLNKVPVRGFSADWKSGKSAGMRRNAEMADYADVALVFWDGASTGTRDMLDQMKKRDKHFILIYSNKIGFDFE